MSDKPRVFVSAVSSEFGQTRQDVANILTRLGFEPVLQDVFGVEAGDLRQMLREKIDACDGLIQIVGQAYGFEPPVPDEEFGRVSYTQFEYLYARKQGKKTWLILTPPGFADDAASGRLDLPPRVDHPDPQGYRAERRALQERYREGLQKGSDVWYDAADKTELALKVERLRDDLARLRKAFHWWHRWVTPFSRRGDAAYLGQRGEPIETATSSTLPEPHHAAEPTEPIEIRDNVQFTVFRPRAVPPSKWCPLLAFAHLAERPRDDLDGPDPLEEVDRLAKQSLETDFRAYGKTTQDSANSIPRYGEIIFIPAMEGIQFNPPRHEFQWLEHVYKAEFRLCASPQLEGKTARGTLTVLLGSMILAEITLQFRVDKVAGTDDSEATERASARHYRNIFASYSHADAAIVRQFDEYARAFGDRYLRDVVDLRAGQLWNKEIMRLIEQANVFQLFWSHNAMRSKIVRKEWEYALSLGRSEFIRPTYWETPFPEAPEAGLPPESLREIQFQFIGTLSQPSRSWQRITRSLAATVLLMAVAVVTGSVSWTIFHLHHDDPVAKAIAAHNPDLIRAQLEKSIGEAYDRDVAEARKVRDWKERQKALRDAEQDRDQKLARLDEFLGSITQTIASGQASPEFLELSRILQEQGVRAALDYLSSQESRLLDRASQLAAMHQREVRRTLAPLLKGVRLHIDRGDLAEAERLCEKLLAADADWPEARHQHVWTMIASGDRALRYENLMAARQRFDSARTSAERLMQLDPGKPAWQRDLSVSYERLGDENRQAGRLDAARGFYQQGLDIAKKLADADPADAQAQRDLAVSYNKLGDVSQQAGRRDAARAFYEHDLEIAKKLAAADPADAQVQRDLSLSYDRLGDVSLQAGRLDVAREFYQQGLDIRKKLAATDPADAQAESDLTISYNNLGYVSRQAGRWDAAREFYQQELNIAKKLADADPADAEAQRDLSFSYDNLGDLSQQATRLDVAREFYQKSLDIRKKLTATDPADAQAQRDLSISYDNLGDVSRPTGQLEVARAFYQQGLDIRKKLAAADPADAQAQSDLSISYEKLGEVSQQSSRLDAARDFYQQGLDITKKQAAADPTDAQAQHDLSNLYEKLGDVSQQSSRLDAAREFYRQSLDIRKKLAVADPADAQAQRDLMVSYYKLAQLAQANEDFAIAIENYERSIAVLEGMVRKGQQIAQSQEELASLKILLSRCRQSPIAAGAWDALLKQPADNLPELLRLRIQLLAARRQIDGVAQAAEALGNLRSKTPANLYNAACGYGLCAKLAAGWPGQGPFAPPKGTTVAKVADPKSEQKYLRAALDLLQAAVKAGYKNLAWMQEDPDLAAVRDLPEFKKLLTEADPRGH